MADQKEDQKPPIATKSVMATYGKLGGEARARRLNDRERSASASKAARARWAKAKGYA